MLSHIPTLLLGIVLSTFGSCADTYSSTWELQSIIYPLKPNLLSSRLTISFSLLDFPNGCIELCVIMEIVGWFNNGRY